MRLNAGPGDDGAGIGVQLHPELDLYFVRSAGHLLELQQRRRCRVPDLDQGLVEGDPGVAQDPARVTPGSSSISTITEPPASSSNFANCVTAPLLITGSRTTTWDVQPLLTG
jgi:hypothetical protein